jgi:hypothetical protein
MLSARTSSSSAFAALVLLFGLPGCGLDGHHADLSAVHQGTPGCLDAACHPGFTAAGTVFWDLDGLEAAEDVEILLIDAGGGETRVAVSGPSGLFWAEHALPAGQVTFQVGDQRSEAHEMPGHAECNLCHRPGGLEGSEGTLVARDVFPPILVSASPADGSEGVDPEAEIALTFSEPVDPATVGASTVRLLGPAGAHPAELISVDGADTIVLRPEAPLAESSGYTVVVERGLGDLAGNGVEVQIQVTLRTASDGSPRVVASTPAAGEDLVDPAATITLWVEPALDASSVSARSVALSPACDQAGLEARWSVDEGAVIARPLLDLPGGTTCALEVQGLISAAGAVQDGTWTLAFSTWPDGTAPAAVSAVPAAGAVAVSTEAAVQIAWSEDLDPATVPDDALLVRTIGDEAVPGSADLLGRVLHWIPDEVLPAGETLVASLNALPADRAGNRATQLPPWSFTVGRSADLTGPVVRGMEPAEGSVDVPVDAVLGLRLSEDPDLTTLADGVSLSSGGEALPIAVSWDGGGGLLSVQPLVALAPTTLYELAVSEVLLDLSGNPAEARALRFTTTSSGDAGAPVFEGLETMEGVDTSTIRLAWSPATDFETPASELVYHAYLATESGAQDLDSPTITTEPGATELEIGGLEVGTTYWAVVRVEDADGNIDDNEAELSGSPLVGFAEVVLPIIVERCVQCHGSPWLYGDLDVRSWDSLLESPSIVPFDSDHSEFVNYGSHHGSGWFTDEEEGLVRAWIDQGALDN